MEPNACLRTPPVAIAPAAIAPVVIGNAAWSIGEPRRAHYAAHRQPADQALLRETIRELRLAMSVLAVAIGALRRQNADHDADVAEVLERYGSDRLDVQIEKLQRLLEETTGLAQ